MPDAGRWMLDVIIARSEATKQLDAA